MPSELTAITDNGRIYVHMYIDRSTPKQWSKHYLLQRGTAEKCKRLMKDGMTNLADEAARAWRGCMTSDGASGYFWVRSNQGMSTSLEFYLSLLLSQLFEELKLSPRFVTWTSTQI